MSYRTIEFGSLRKGQQPPFVTYRDHTQTQTFSGDKVDVTDTEAGQIVTVVIVHTVDQGDTTFNFLVPAVNADDQSVTSAPVHTVGIVAMHPTSLAPPFGHGQLETFSAFALTGTASQSRIRPLALSTT